MHVKIVITPRADTVIGAILSMDLMGGGTPPLNKGTPMGGGTPQESLSRHGWTPKMASCDANTSSYRLQTFEIVTLAVLDSMGGTPT